MNSGYVAERLEHSLTTARDTRPKSGIIFATEQLAVRALISAVVVAAQTLAI